MFVKLNRNEYFYYNGNFNKFTTMGIAWCIYCIHYDCKNFVFKGYGKGMGDVHKGMWCGRCNVNGVCGVITSGIITLITKYEL